MDAKEETALVEEMEQLRQELQHLLSGNPELLSSPKACALSARLDLLITRYMSAKKKTPLAGS